MEKDQILWPTIPVIFTFTVSIWGMLLQPAILNKCHLTVWLLIFEAVRNLAIVEQHATLSWWHTTINKVFRLAQ